MISDMKILEALLKFASNKLEKGPLRDYETAFWSPLALTVLEKRIFKG
jgi:hypothetical protein